MYKNKVAAKAITELRLECINLVNGGLCNCYCSYSAITHWHHKDKTIRVSELKGPAADASACSLLCATLPNGVIERCVPINDVLFINGGITGQLPSFFE